MGSGCEVKASSHDERALGSGGREDAVDADAMVGARKGGDPCGSEVWVSWEVREAGCQVGALDALAFEARALDFTSHNGT